MCNLCFILDYCKTPNGESGTCIDLQQCEELFNELLQSKFDKHKLENFYCGWNGLNRKVCCTRNKNLLPDNCGEEPKAALSRIVGGDIANIDEFPWMVLLEYEKGGYT